MTEHDLHEPLRRLAETAPAPASELAADIVERGRTARRRRLGGVAVAGAAAVAALVVVVPLLGWGSTDQGAEPPMVTDPTTTTEPPPPPEPSARMQVAAAGMRTLLRETDDRLWVRDSVCDRWNGRDSNRCTDFTAAEMADLERLLPAYSLTWVDTSPGVFERGKPYVEVSELEDVSADGGTVFVYALRGLRDCAGISYEVRLRPDGPPIVRRPDRTRLVIC